MRNIITILYLVLSLNLSSQSIEMDTIIIYHNDRIISEARNLFISEIGDFYYYQDFEGKRLFINNNDTLSLIPHNGVYGIYGPNGDIATFYISKDTFYYKNTNSTKLYSNGIGKILNHMTDFTNDNVALTTQKGDSLYYFLNGSLVSINHRDSIDVYPNLDKWCSFSANGNALYYIKNQHRYYLYFNTQLIDSTEYRFIQLQVNNAGDYFYGVGKKGIPNTNFDYMFYPNYNGIKYDSVRTIWKAFLGESGGFYCSGGNPTYLLINGTHYKFPVPEDIILPDSINFFYFDDVRWNHIFYTAEESKNLKYRKIIKPTMNRNGEYAFFVKSLFNKRLFLNGTYQDLKIIGNPISNNPKGSFISYKQSFTSTRIYADNRLEFKMPGKIRIYDRVQFFEEFLQEYGMWNIPNFDKPFDYFEIGERGFIIWDGNISKPILKVIPKSIDIENPEIGQIMAGELTEAGYYIFQYVGNEKIILILNNDIIDLGNEIFSILENSIYFEQNKLIFYAICKDKVIKYTINTGANKRSYAMRGIVVY